MFSINTITLIPIILQILLQLDIHLQPFFHLILPLDRVSNLVERLLVADLTWYTQLLKTFLSNLEERCAKAFENFRLRLANLVVIFLLLRLSKIADSDDGFPIYFLLLMYSLQRWGHAANRDLNWVLRCCVVVVATSHAWIQNAMAKLWRNLVGWTVLTISIVNCDCLLLIVCIHHRYHLSLSLITLSIVQIRGDGWLYNFLSRASHRVPCLNS